MPLTLTDPLINGKTASTGRLPLKIIYWLVNGLQEVEYKAKLVDTWIFFRAG
jgi:hypothetical protein